LSESGFIRPTLAELVARIDGDLSAVLGTIDGEDQRSLRMALARVESQVTHLLYGYLDTLAKMVLPDQASLDFLARHSTVWGILRLPAEFAQGVVTFTGAPNAGIASDTRLKAADGTEYATTAIGVLEGAGPGTATVPVIAVLPGISGNLGAGSMLTMISPAAGVVAAATVAGAGLNGGFDAESDDKLRERLLARIRMPPHGGADFDYETWVKESDPRVTRVFTTPRGMGNGTVVVRPMMDGAYEHGIPLEADIDAIQEYLDAARPVTADVYAVAPVAQALDYTIHVSPDTAMVRQAVTAELADLHRRDATPNTGNYNGTLLISHIREAVSIAAGESDNAVSVPAANVTADPGKILTLGVITWV